MAGYLLKRRRVPPSTRALLFGGIVAGVEFDSLPASIVGGAAPSTGGTPVVGLWSPRYATLPQGTPYKTTLADLPAFGPADIFEPSDPTDYLSLNAAVANAVTRINAGAAHCVVVIDPALTRGQSARMLAPPARTNPNGHLSIVSKWVVNNGPIRPRYQTVQDADVSKMGVLIYPSTTDASVGGDFLLKLGDVSYGADNATKHSKVHIEGIRFALGSDLPYSNGLVWINQHPGGLVYFNHADVPNEISFQHCMFEGRPTPTLTTSTLLGLTNSGAKYGIFTSGGSLMVRGCRFKGMGYPGWSDMGALGANDFTGPIYWEANWAEGGGIQLMLGPSNGLNGYRGGDAWIVRSHFGRDRAMQTASYIEPAVKSLVEMKNVDRVLIEANDLDQNWYGGDFRGDGFSIKSVNQDNIVSGFSYGTSNVTVRHNRVRTPQPFNFSVTNVAVGSYPLDGLRFLDVINNLFEIQHRPADGSNGGTYEGPHGIGVASRTPTVLLPPRSLGFRRNSWVRHRADTGVNDLHSGMMLGNPGPIWGDNTTHDPMAAGDFQGWELEDNVFPSSQYGWWTSDGQTGGSLESHLKSLNTRLRGNIVCGWSAGGASPIAYALNSTNLTGQGYTEQAAMTQYLSDDDIPFTDAAGRNYRITGAQSQRGCDQGVIEAETAHCVDGLWTSDWVPRED